MKDLKECVVESLDGVGNSLFPYLPYLLQDVIEIGSDPNVVNTLIKNHIVNLNSIKVLDLGCGKGAVSVPLAKEFGGTVVGLDAIPDFIASAKGYAKAQNVSNLCNFKVADIRVVLSDYKNFDLAILGAIGPVFGPIEETLTKVEKCLTAQGYIIIDDGYVPNDYDFNHDKASTQNEFYQQIANAGFDVMDKQIISLDSMKEQNAGILSVIEQRAKELMEAHPAKSKIFEDYIKAQVEETYALENKLICGCWLLKKQK